MLHTHTHTRLSAMVQKKKHLSTSAYEHIFIFSGNDRSRCPHAFLIQTPCILPELMWDLTLHHDILTLLPEKPTPQTTQLWRLTSLLISSLKLRTAKQCPSVTLLRFFNSPPQHFLDGNILILTSLPTLSSLNETIYQEDTSLLVIFHFKQDSRYHL